MTAQIAVLNKNGVALASDSALTFTNKNGSDERRNSKKLFSLSKYHPIGILVYEKAAFMGLSWEKLIKIYRKKLGKTKFDKLDDYLRDFRKFLEDFESYPDIEQNSAQEAFLESTVTYIFSKLHKEIDECISYSEVRDNILAGVDKVNN